MERPTAEEWEMMIDCSIEKLGKKKIFTAKRLCSKSNSF
jgi:hypothetical protein